MVHETKAVAQVIRDISKALAERDPYFAMYTIPTTTPGKTHYVILDETIFNALTELVVVGYSMDSDLMDKTRILSQIKSTVYSFLEKRRAEFNKKHGKNSCSSSAKDFKDELTRNPNFRQNRIETFEDESQLFHDDRDSYVPNFYNM
ncbi:unnamed protein product [Caenorhabditis sp. 36 PRJEB53466]|nr:unnamed protein product [Caenorhabditis sp. 36 PRJEB53466]